jgi:hypothetical protein
MTIKYRRNGREAGAAEALDEDGILRDGFSVMVPMTMRDGSLTPLQRSIAQNARLHNGHGNYAVVGHRPGYVFSTDASLNDAKERAYAAYDAELRDAYKHPQGLRGDINARDEAHDALAVMDERERAYREHDEADANAWRGPRDSGKW